MRFDVERFISDVGGSANAAKLAGVSRATPYRWVKVGHISTKSLQRIKEALPGLDLNTYFIR